MTSDDIIRMAREADLHERVKDGVGYVVRIPNLEQLERFAALVVAAEREKLTKAAMSAAKIAIEEAMELERESCAEVCDRIKNDIYNNSHEDIQPMAHAVANFCAAAIRARNEQEQPR